MSTPSIRRTLLVRTGIGVGLLLCLLSTAAYVLVRRGLYEELDRSIRQAAALLANEVEIEDGRIVFEWQEGIGTNVFSSDEGLFQYWNEATGETARSPALGERDLPRFHAGVGKSVLREIEIPGIGIKARAIGMRIYPFVDPEERDRLRSNGRVIDPKSMPHILVVARDAAPVHRILTQLRWTLGLGTLGTLAIGWFLIHHTIRFSLRPIHRLAGHVRTRTGSDLDSALEMPGRLPKELIGLAEDFDSLLARVAAIRVRERDFIRHAAHELRTPIAGLQATTEVALSKPRDAAAYAASLEACGKTAGELGTLVKRLSALARIGSPGQPVAPTPLDLAVLFRDCLHAFRGDLERRGITPEIHASEPPPVALADPALVRIICNNLIDNALSHGSQPGGLVIRFLRNGDAAEMRISNPVDVFPEEPDRLFEPLFRRNESRDDAGTHLGIGLTLGREAAAAMDGTLTATRAADGWIEFLLVLPAAP